MTLLLAGFEKMTTLRLRKQAPERCNNRFCILGLEPDGQSAGYADTPGCGHHSDVQFLFHQGSLRQSRIARPLERNDQKFFQKINYRVMT